VRIFGARNEVVAFQLILQANSEGAKGLRVEISDLENGGERIPGSAAGSSDPFDYLGKSVELFTEHYLNITKRSTGGSAWDADAKPSDYYLGPVPDALIPMAAPAGLGGAPFEISPDRNQGVWADLWIPRDVAAGVYSGSILVRAGEGASYDIPLLLQVYGFTLPDETHFRNMFAIEASDIAGRHGVQAESPAYYEIEARYHQMAHRHRLDLVRPVPNLSRMNTYHRRYLAGDLYTAAYGYAGPGEGVGNGTFSIGLYGAVPDEYGGDIHNWSEQSWWSGSDAWAEWFKAKAPQVAVHKYLFPDEPGNDWALARIEEQGQWSHSNPGPGATIPTLATYWVDEALLGFVDHWSISAHLLTKPNAVGLDPALLGEERGRGRTWSFYNGYRPASGSTLMDAGAVEFRVLPWIGWKYEPEQYFYWMTTYWTDWTDDGRHPNVFSDPMTSRFLRNGSGTFFYPGQDMLYGEENRSLPGPLSSIRMKNWRRGMQDYEYLWLATQLGLQTDVEAAVDAVVPTALWEADLAKDATWPSHGYGFERYRRQLAEQIALLTQEDPEPAVQAEYDLVPIVPRSSLFDDVPPEHPYRQAIEAVVLGGYAEGCAESPAQFCPDAPITRAEFAVMILRALVGVGPPPEMPGVQVFEDVPLAGDRPWAAKYVNALWEAGIVAGCQPQPMRFCPDDTVTRTESAVVFLRLLHGKDYIPEDAQGIFSDMFTTWWGTRWAEAAYRQSLIPACESSAGLEFCPQASLSRAMAAYTLAMVEGLHNR